MNEYALLTGQKSTVVRNRQKATVIGVLKGSVTRVS